MTEDSTYFANLFGDETRRSVLQKTALATAGAGLATSASGTAAAQEDGDGILGDDQEFDKAIMPVSHFRPRANFVITSPVLQWTPKVQDIRDNVWSEYNTRMIRYLNTDEYALWFQAQQAEVPEFDQQAGYVVDAEGDTGPNDSPQPEVFQMHSEYSAFGDSGFVTVNFTPVGEDEENNLLDNEDWWFDDEGGDAVGGDATDGNATGNGL